MSATAATTTKASNLDLSGETSMSDILEAFPGAKRALFARYHIGGCQSCSYADDETLAEVCKRNEDLPVAEVIDHIQKSHEEDLKILIEPTDLAEQLESGADSSPKLIDVRTREEFEAVKLPDAILFGNETLNEIYSSWDKSTAIVVYDHTGNRSLDPAAYLIGHGYKNTRALRGGIDAWSQEADSTVQRYRVEME